MRRRAPIGAWVAAIGSVAWRKRMTPAPSSTAPYPSVAGNRPTIRSTASSPVGGTVGDRCPGTPGRAGRRGHPGPERLVAQSSETTTGSRDTTCAVIVRALGRTRPTTAPVRRSHAIAGSTRWRIVTAGSPADRSSLTYECIRDAAGDPARSAAGRSTGGPSRCRAPTGPAWGPRRTRTVAPGRSDGMNTLIQTATDRRAGGPMVRPRARMVV